MLNREYSAKLESNFIKAYKEFLISRVYGDKQMFKDQFKNARIKTAFCNLVKEYFATIEKFYTQKPNGTYKEEMTSLEQSPVIKHWKNEYVSLTNDIALFDFLRCYSYCAEQFNNAVFDTKGEFSSINANHQVKKVSKMATEMYEVVKNDFAAKNYWWLNDNATALRRQLTEQMVLIGSDRIRKMLDKYFDRKVELDEFMKNADLVKELDITMYNKRHASPYYFWVGKNAEGETKLFMSPQPPESGVYTYVSYQTYTHEEAQVKTHDL